MNIGERIGEWVGATQNLPAASALCPVNIVTFAYASTFSVNFSNVKLNAKYFRATSKHVQVCDKA